jgi:hypothetical protein
LRILAAVFGSYKEREGEASIKIVSWVRSTFHSLVEGRLAGQLQSLIVVEGRKEFNRTKQVAPIVRRMTVGISMMGLAIPTKVQSRLRPQRLGLPHIHAFSYELSAGFFAKNRYAKTTNPTIAAKSPRASTPTGQSNTLRTIPTAHIAQHPCRRGRRISPFEYQRGFTASLERMSSCRAIFNSFS